MNPDNPFLPTKSSAPAPVVAETRAAQEIQASLVIAKRFPRDPVAAFDRVMQACSRKGLAEEASYEYSKGGTAITGASIRLAEVLFQSWGNCVSGVIELERDGDTKESRVMAFGWDLETNTRDLKEFVVSHTVQLKGGGVKTLSDPREVYEHVANQAARRKRACMLAVLPQDLVDKALEKCDDTLKSGHTVPLIDRVQKMVSAFREVGVIQEQLEDRLGKKLEACTEGDIIRLGKIFNAIRDGIANTEQFFAPVVRKSELVSTPPAPPYSSSAGTSPSQADHEPQAPEPPKRKPGRPPGSKNKVTQEPPLAPAPEPEPEPETQPSSSHDEDTLLI